MKSVEVTFQGVTTRSAISSSSLRSFAISEKNSRFQDLKRLLVSEPSSGQDNIFNELKTFQRRILSGKTLSAHEILAYQIRAHQFGMQIELISKVAESAVSTLRRLQASQ